MSYCLDLMTDDAIYPRDYNASEHPKESFTFQNAQGLGIFFTTILTG